MIGRGLDDREKGGLLLVVMPVENFERFIKQVSIRKAPNVRARGLEVFFFEDFDFWNRLGEETTDIRPGGTAPNEVVRLMVGPGRDQTFMQDGLRVATRRVAGYYIGTTGDDGVHPSGGKRMGT